MKASKATVKVKHFHQVVDLPNGYYLINNFQIAAKCRGKYWSVMDTNGQSTFLGNEEIYETLRTYKLIKEFTTEVKITKR